MRVSSARLRKLALLLTAFVLAIPAAPSSAFAARTLGLSTMRKEFRVDAGGDGSGSVVVSNNGEEPLDVLLYVADQEVDEKGLVTFTAPGRENLSSLTGPAGWVRIDVPAEAKAIGNIPYLHLEPRQSVEVEYSFIVPLDTPSGDHNSVIFFEMFSLPGATQGSSSQVTGRIGSRVKVRVTGDIIERLEPAGFDVDGFVMNEPMSYSLALENRGNVDKRVEVRLALLDGKGVERASSEVATDAPVYARERAEFTGDLDLPGDLPRKYTARMTVSFKSESGADETMVEERSVWVVPLWCVIAVGGVAALLLLWIVWRIALALAKRRMRRRGEPETGSLAADVRDEASPGGGTGGKRSA